VGFTGVSHVAHCRPPSSLSLCHVHAREQARLLVCYRYVHEGSPDAATILTAGGIAQTASVSLDGATRLSMTQSTEYRNQPVGFEVVEAAV
jgi:hypothetical protein